MAKKDPFSPAPDLYEYDEFCDLIGVPYHASRQKLKTAYEQKMEELSVDQTPGSDTVGQKMQKLHETYVFIMAYRDEDSCATDNPPELYSLSDVEDLFNDPRFSLEYLIKSYIMADNQSVSMVAHAYFEKKFPQLDDQITALLDNNIDFYSIWLVLLKNNSLAEIIVTAFKLLESEKIGRDKVLGLLNDIDINFFWQALGEMPNAFALSCFLIEKKYDERLTRSLLMALETFAASHGREIISLINKIIKENSQNHDLLVEAIYLAEKIDRQLAKKLFLENFLRHFPDAAAWPKEYRDLGEKLEILYLSQPNNYLS